MPSQLFNRRGLLFLAFLLSSSLVAEVPSGSGYATQGGEYSPTGGLPGDQVRPSVAIGSAGGFIAFEDSVTDGSGLGISARKLDSSLSGAFSTFRVNVIGTNDQEQAQVTMLKNNGAVFGWQGGRQGFQQIYVRVLSSSNTWLTSDVMLNAVSNGNHIHLALATLAGGNVVGVWSSFNQVSTTSMQDVFGQRLSPTGAKLGGEFRINLATAYNQRAPTVAALANGDFVAAWVSEQQRFQNSVDIYARIFDANGAPKTGEILVNTSTNLCANPSVAAGSDGGFVVAWGEKDLVVLNNSWDIWARGFDGAGVGGAVARINANTYGDQYAPHVAANGTDYMAVWTSLRQDGSWEGVFGRFLAADASVRGPELQVNTTTISKQMHPCVAADSAGHFLVAWTSFIGGPNSFDLFAQRYSASTQTLLTPDAPFVSGLSSSSLLLAWPAVSGLSVTNYELYEDGSATPSFTTTNIFLTRSGLAPSTTKAYRLAYVTSDGQRSPLSAAGLGTTWGADANGDGLPDDWQALYWGVNPANWPSASADSDGDGVSNLAEFLAGTNPTDAASVLKQQIVNTPQGMFLKWNTQPGSVYQVEMSTDLSSWVTLGSPRFAAGATDQILVNATGSVWYRVNRLR